MGEDTATKKRKAESTPPEGYVCRLCSIPGHWIQVCPTKKTGTKRQRKKDHVPVPGKDPSKEDIEEAKELQKIPPPKCFCGLPSRLNKVKRSKEGGDISRAIGKYFFFCSKKRDDETQCRFARPVEMELNKTKKGASRNSRANNAKLESKGGMDKGDGKKSDMKKPKQTCKFFAKGSCKKGKRCQFSHEVKPETTSSKPQGKPKVREKVKAEEEAESDGSSSSGSDSSNEAKKVTSKPQVKQRAGENLNAEDGAGSDGSSSSVGSSCSDGSGSSEEKGGNKRYDESGSSSD
ncbi:hypothetical protein ACHAWF_008865 [Thalassiosira exigua]